MSHGASARHMSWRAIWGWSRASGARASERQQGAHHQGGRHSRMRWLLVEAAWWRSTRISVPSARPCGAWAGAHRGAAAASRSPSWPWPALGRHPVRHAARRHAVRPHSAQASACTAEGRSRRPEDRRRESSRILQVRTWAGERALVSCPPARRATPRLRPEPSVPSTVRRRRRPPTQSAKRRARPLAELPSLDRPNSKNTLDTGGSLQRRT